MKVSRTALRAGLIGLSVLSLLVCLPLLPQLPSVETQMFISHLGNVVECRLPPDGPWLFAPSVAAALVGVGASLGAARGLQNRVVQALVLAPGPFAVLLLVLGVSTFRQRLRDAPAELAACQERQRAECRAALARPENRPCAHCAPVSVGACWDVPSAQRGQR